jgi:hypothetical protein
VISLLGYTRRGVLAYARDNAWLVGQPMHTGAMLRIILARPLIGPESQRGKRNTTEKRPFLLLFFFTFRMGVYCPTCQPLSPYSSLPSPPPPRNAAARWTEQHLQAGASLLHCRVLRGPILRLHRFWGELHSSSSSSVFSCFCCCCGCVGAVDGGCNGADVRVCIA